MRDVQHRDLTRAVINPIKNSPIADAKTKQSCQRSLQRLNVVVVAGIATKRIEATIEATLKPGTASLIEPRGASSEDDLKHGGASASVY